MSLFIDGVNQDVAGVDFGAVAEADMEAQAQDALVVDNLDHLLKVVDGGTTSPTKVVDNSILSIVLTKDSGGDISDFNNSTDSLEAQSDKIGAYSGDGGAAADDSVKAEADLIKAKTDNIGVVDATAVVTPDTVSSLMAYLKGLEILVTSNRIMREADEVGVFQQGHSIVNNEQWTCTSPATGSAWAQTYANGFSYSTTIPNADETARATVSSTRYNIYLPISSMTINSVIKRFIYEFEMKLANVANMDNTKCFFGLTTLNTDDRSSNDIIGFGLASDVLTTVTDSGGTETVNTTFGETLTNHNKFRIECYLNGVKFYLNEALLSTHTTNIPNIGQGSAMFYIDTEAGGAATLSIGITRYWYEDMAR